MRNRYVHAVRGSAPLRLEAGTHLITERVLDPLWLATMQVLVEGSKRDWVIPIGDDRLALVTDLVSVPAEFERNRARCFGALTPGNGICRTKSWFATAASGWS